MQTCFTIYGIFTFIVSEVLEESITHHINNSISVCVCVCVCGGGGGGGGGESMNPILV